MAGDLFEAIDSLFRKRRVEDPPTDYILNRFMASRPEFAPFAAEIGLRVRDTAMAWEVWRAAVPRAPSAPRLSYPAPKKGPAAEELAAAIADRTHLTREEAETAVDRAKADGRTAELKREFGVE